MCVSKVQHVMGRKSGCNRSRPVFFGFLIFRQTSQLATEKIQNLCNRNRWSGLFRLGSVRFRSFFQSSELDLRTLHRSHPTGRVLAIILVSTHTIFLFDSLADTAPWKREIGVSKSVSAVSLHLFFSRKSCCLSPVWFSHPTVRDIPCTSSRRKGGRRNLYCWTPFKAMLSAVGYGFSPALQPS